MEVQWAEERRRKRAGSFLKSDVMQKVLELVVHERMSQGDEVRHKRKEERERMVSIGGMVPRFEAHSRPDR